MSFAPDKAVKQWMGEVLGRQLDDSSTLQDLLRSGVLLCETMNTLYPNSIKKIGKLSSPFVMMENIQAYLSACKTQGIGFTFAPSDLFEGKNLGAVIKNVYALAAAAKRPVPLSDAEVSMSASGVSVDAPAAPPALKVSAEPAPRVPPSMVATAQETPATETVSMSVGSGSKSTPAASPPRASLAEGLSDATVTASVSPQPPLTSTQPVATGTGAAAKIRDLAADESVSSGRKPGLFSAYEAGRRESLFSDDDNYDSYTPAPRPAAQPLYTRSSQPPVTVSTSASSDLLRASSVAASESVSLFGDEPVARLATERTVGQLPSDPSAAALPEFMAAGLSESRSTSIGSGGEGSASKTLSLDRSFSHGRSFAGSNAELAADTDTPLSGITLTPAASAEVDPMRLAWSLLPSDSTALWAAMDLRAGSGEAQAAAGATDELVVSRTLQRLEDAMAAVRSLRQENEHLKALVVHQQSQLLAGQRQAAAAAPARQGVALPMLAVTCEHTQSYFQLCELKIRAAETQRAQADAHRVFLHDVQYWVSQCMHARAQLRDARVRESGPERSQENEHLSRQVSELTQRLSDERSARQRLASALQSLYDAIL